MSKYTITHSCGHTAEHNIIGTNVNNERDKKAAWLAGRVCADCYRQEQIQQAADNTASLPTLVGTEKQIAWATTIRSNAATSIRQMQSELSAIPDGDPRKSAALSIMDGALQQAECRYWIDRRDSAFDRGWVKNELAKLAK
ncbi:hypothetical protein [Chromobacterium phragmitis]|uniref:hypothetical protein n=1 Tax=Chromobacterium phragmitis TaxID=2202141 RepID=UPI0038779C93